MQPIRQIRSQQILRLEDDMLSAETMMYRCGISQVPPAMYYFISQISPQWGL